MKKWLSKFAVLLAIATVPVWSAAQVSTESAEELIRKSGLLSSLADTSRQIRMGMQENPAFAAADPAIADRIGGLIDAAYAPNKLYLSVLSHLTAKGTQRDVDQSLIWYRSPTGQLITTAEETSQREMTSMQDLLAHGNLVLKNSTAERHALIARVMKHAKVIDSAVNAQLLSALATYQGVLSVVDAKGAPTVAEFRRMLEAQKPALSAAMVGTYTSILASTYNKLTDSDLRKYADFLASASGAMVVDVINDAVESAYIQSAKEFGEKLPPPKEKKAI